MATCKECIHYDICLFHITGNENELCGHFIHTADVASNAEKLKPLILAMNEKNDRLPIMLAKAKTETARSIFKDLREMVIPEKCTNGCDFYIDMAELTALEEEYCGKDTNDGHKKTNFDCIKEMSVEEFSEFL